MELLQIYAVHDDSMRHLQEAAGTLARGNHAIHPPDQPLRIAFVLALAGGGEEQPHRGATYVAQQDTAQHFQITPRMPDPERPCRRPFEQARKLRWLKLW